MTGGGSGAGATGAGRASSGGFTATVLGAAGGAAAVLVFLAFSWWAGRNMATPQADQAAALFGTFAIGWSGYLGVALMVMVIGVLTAATSHVTVIAYLSDLDLRQTEG